MLTGATQDLINRELASVGGRGILVLLQSCWFFTFGFN